MSEEENKDNNNNNQEQKKVKEEKYGKELKRKHREVYKRKDESVDKEDKDFDGPNPNRGCTDILFCLFFFAFIAGCAVITGIGFSEGNPTALTYLYDEDGNACGKSDSLAKDFPYLFLYNAVAQLNSLDTKFANQGICVKACPTKYTDVVLDCWGTTNNPTCSVDPTNIYLAEPFLEKICIPSKTLYEEFKKNATSFNNETAVASADNEFNAVGGLINTKIINTDKLFAYIGDMKIVWPIFIACVGIAVVIGFIFLFVVRCCAPVIAWLVVFIILVLLVLLGYFFQKRMDKYEAVGDTTYRNIMLAFAIIFYSLSLIWLLIILCSCNKIRLSIAIIQASARFMADTLSIILVPLIFFIVVALYLAYWIALSIYIYSSGEITKSDTTFLATVKW